MVLGEGEDMPGNSTDGTKGDLMVLGSNQEVQKALWWNGCWTGWWHALEWSFQYPCDQVPQGLGEKERLGPGESSHSLILTLIPHM